MGKEVNDCFSGEGMNSVKSIDSETNIPSLMDEAQRKVKLTECLSNGFSGSNLTTKEYQEVLFLMMFSAKVRVKEVKRTESDNLSDRLIIFAV